MRKECYVIRVKYFDGRLYEENEFHFVSSVDACEDFRCTPSPLYALKFYTRNAASSFADGLNDLVSFTAEFEICHYLY